MLGKLVVDGTPVDSVPFDNPDVRNLVQEVSMKVKTSRASLSVSLSFFLNLSCSLSSNHYVYQSLLSLLSLVYYDLLSLALWHCDTLTPTYILTLTHT